MTKTAVQLVHLVICPKNNLQKSGIVAHAWNPSHSGTEIRRIMVQGQPWQIYETLSWKNQSQKRAGGMAQGVGPEFKRQY
jgi:hypothetical protein